MAALLAGAAGRSRGFEAILLAGAAVMTETKQLFAASAGSVDFAPSLCVSRSRWEKSDA